MANAKSHMLASRLRHLGPPAIASIATLGLTALLALFAFWTKGGLISTRTGPAFALAIVLATLLVAYGTYRGRLAAPRHGAASALWLAALAALSAISTGWSVTPHESAIDATRTFAYLAIFVAALAAAKTWSEHTRKILVALTATALVVCVYALISRVIPAAFDETVVYARLREPFEYWNSVAAVAAIALAGSVWIGTSRELSRTAAATAYPIAGIALVVLVMSESRGALLATAVALAFWLLVVPLRLRSAAFLLCAGVVAAAMLAWVFGQNALATDGAPLALRESTGRQFGALLIVMIGALYLAGMAVETLRRDHPVAAPWRRRIGVALLGAVALLPVAGAAALATTDRGLAGSISDGVGNMVDVKGTTPGNSISRLAATSNLRARYWNDAFKIWNDNRLHGTGADSFAAARAPYRHDTINVRHAHGFIPQTMADLGLTGLGVVIALLIAWLVAGGRTLGVRRRRPTAWIAAGDGERIALAALATIALAYGVLSTVDWIWYTPAVTVIALIAAGWLAGWRPANHPATDDRDAPVIRGAWRRAVPAVQSLAITLVGLTIAWSALQPARAAQRVEDGFELAAAKHTVAARQAARDALTIDPTAIDPYYVLNAAEHNAGRRVAAELALQQAALRQPSNPEPWFRLAEYRLTARSDPANALATLRVALFLDPASPTGREMFVQAKTQLGLMLAERAARAAARRLARKARRRMRAGATPAIGAAPPRTDPPGAREATQR